MKTTNRHSRLAVWLALCATTVMVLAPSGASGADPSKNVVARPKQATTEKVSRDYYVFLSGSGIPQPIDRIQTPIATTAIPMMCIGNRGNR